MRINHLALGILILCLSCGCIVYKSSDRDDFNSHGKERAPASSKPTPDCMMSADLTAEAEVITTETGRIVKLPDGSIYPLCANQPTTP